MRASDRSCEMKLEFCTSPDTNCIPHPRRENKVHFTFGTDAIPMETCSQAAYAVVATNLSHMTPESLKSAPPFYFLTGGSVITRYFRAFMVRLRYDNIDKVIMPRSNRQWWFRTFHVLFVVFEAVFGTITV